MPGIIGTNGSYGLLILLYRVKLESLAYSVIQEAVIEVLYNIEFRR